MVFLTSIFIVLNRLTSASGTFAGDRVTQPPLGNDFYAVYTLAMTYSNTGRINTKNQWHELNGTAEAANTYQHSYSYVAGKHQVEQLTDENQNREVYTYDLNGNLSGWEDNYPESLCSRD